MTIPTSIQRTLTSNLLIVPTVVVTVTVVFLWNLIRKNQDGEKVSVSARRS